MSMHAVGRHRAPGRLNPLKSFSSAVKRSTRPAVTASLAAGGLMAAMAGPASAAPAAPAPAADAVVLSGNAASKVTYGLSVVTKAPAKSATTFKGVSLASRPSAATVAARTAATAAPTVATRTASTATRAASVPRAAAAPASLAPAAAPRSGVLGIAAGLSGIPYRWGGTTPAGFDCSGFTQYVFRQAGVSLPRTAAAQRAATIPVSNPQPGDLIFFGTWHVGIYAGPGKMYDSPTAGQTTGLHSIWSSGVTYGRVR